jgi:hypothetical protein
MARDIDERLRALKSRRSGTDRLDRVATATVQDVLAKSVITESWEKRQASNKHTRYALGAMQSVDPDYTRISLETADRVGKQLTDKLPYSVSLKPQGSVPLDVHIRGISDVDLLVLHGRNVSFDRHGPQANNYTILDTTCLETLMKLRKDSEEILKNAYPVAKVDCSGGKSINLSGGSLPRPVDVVPSQWDDNADYQTSHEMHKRGVRILNKNIPDTIVNLPFLHIHNVNFRDSLVDGALKKAIRLVKNVKNDAEDSDAASKLSSFDVAGLVYHCDLRNLMNARFYELAILAEMQRFFDWCHWNKEAAKALMAPDGTRAVLNTTEKLAAVTVISMELDSLARKVAEEQIKRDNVQSWDVISKALNEAGNLQ